MTRVDPLQNFRFRVEIDNIATAAFSEVVIGPMTVAAIDYREGTDPPHVRKIASPRPATLP
jgi:tail tube protein gp19